ncbi:hypothetical protein C0Q70_13516 [Pomacea canaliculata]|uniref:Proton-coupled folate transporter n=1 Tax=Pomacea canaliculata TaxID=400727 RepID=A0A2T7NXF9_POMCA|nr:hypothetical protein C0Q70_13516 [Pomacea canaliculata]
MASQRAELLINEQETNIDEVDYLLSSPRTTACVPSRVVSAVYGSADFQTSPLTLRGASGKKGDGAPYQLRAREGVEGGTSFSAFRARLVLFFFQILRGLGANVAGPVNNQYIHFRFHEIYFNGTDDTNTSLAASAKCDDNASNPVDEKENALQEDMSELVMYLTNTYYISMLLVTVLLGSSSDIIGRRPLLLIPSFAQVLDQILHSVIVLFHWDLRTLYIPAVLNGLSGAANIIGLGVYALTADLTPPSKSRTMGIAIVEFAGGIPSVAAQILAGVLVQTFGYFIATVFPTFIYFLAFLLVYLYIPETVPKRKGGHTLCVNPVKYLKNIVGLFLSDGTKRERLQLCTALLIITIFFLAVYGYGNVFLMYELGVPFCWDPEMVGIFGGISAAVGSTSQIVSLKLLHYVCSDPVILILGMLSTAGAYVIQGLAQSNAMLFTSIPAGVIGATNSPVIRSILSSKAGADKQGALFTAVAVVETFCSLASNTMYIMIYRSTLHILHGLVFICMAGLLVFNVLLILIFMHLSRVGSVVYEEVIHKEDDLQKT